LSIASGRLPYPVMHPLTQMLLAAARGDPPPADGRIDVWPQPPGRLAAVCAFTGHFVIAADVEPGWVRARLPEGDFIAPTSPAFLDALAQRIGLAPGSHDVVLVPPRAQRSSGSIALNPLFDLGIPGCSARGRSATTCAYGRPRTKPPS